MRLSVDFSVPDDWTDEERRNFVAAQRKLAENTPGVTAAAMETYGVAFSRVRISSQAHVLPSAPAISIIKLIREYTNMGLREAREFIESNQPVVLLPGPQAFSLWEKMMHLEREVPGLRLLSPEEAAVYEVHSS